MTGLRAVRATRYVTPLREGGSLPGLVEAEDLGTYVLKFRGAGQGPKALVAEVVAGELARRLGFDVPELVLLDVDAELGRGEPDEEIQDLLRASVGVNLGMDFLPGSLGFDPVVHRPSSRLASRLLWFDALVSNVDRSWRNPNLLSWHDRVWLIDHGAALYFHHSWATAPAGVSRALPTAADHVVLPWADAVADADADLAPLLSEEVVRAAVSLVPDAWLRPEPGHPTPDALREAYTRHVGTRLADRDAWVTALEVAHAAHV